MTPMEIANVNTQLKLYDEYVSAYYGFKTHKNIESHNFCDLFYKAKRRNVTKDSSNEEIEYVLTEEQFYKLSIMLKEMENPPYKSDIKKQLDIMEDRLTIIGNLKRGT